MIVTHRSIQDLIKPIRQSVVAAVQGDSYSRQIEMTLTADSIPWAVPADSSVSVRYRKADDTRGEYSAMPDGTSAYELGEHTVTIKLAPEVLDVAGKAMLQAVLTNGNQSLAIFTLEIDVQPDPSI